MRRLPRHLILILVLGVILLAPLFEFFDEGQDLEQGTDFVLVLLATFMSTGLFVLCKRMFAFVVRVLVLETIPADPLVIFSNRSIRVEISPPECPAMLGTLRI